TPSGAHERALLVEATPSPTLQALDRRGDLLARTVQTRGDGSHRYSPARHEQPPEGGSADRAVQRGAHIVHRMASNLCGAAAELADVTPERLGGQLEPLGEGQVRRPGARDLVRGQPELDRVDGRLDHITS